tara:strand:+ start:895 stop:1170 length:276 start_codon:yes stop_codon:yes gene_type:complete
MKIQLQVVIQGNFATFATSCDPFAGRKNFVKLVNKLNDFWSSIVPFYPLRPVFYFLVRKCDIIIYNTYKVANLIMAKLWQEKEKRDTNTLL